MAFKAVVEFAKYVWETGKELMDVEVILGSADKSSQCKVILADPMHTIAAAIINHSISSGGIQALQDTNKAPTPVIPGIKPESIPAATASSNASGTVATGTSWTPEVRAFADAVVMRESQDAKDAAYKELGIGTANGDPLKAYYAKNSIAEGYFNEADILAGGGFPASARTSRNVGRYQFNRGDWSDAKKANPAIKGYSPLDQDLVFLYKIQKIDRGWKELQAGDYKAAFRKAANEWVSIPGGRQYQPQGEDKVVGSQAILDRYYKYYLMRLAFYQGKTGNSTAKTKAVAPAPAVKPPPPNATSTAIPVIKGSVITITIEGISYEFIHQATEMSEAGVTILMGQGIRWVMSRRKRSATYKDVSLKQLAEKVAKAHKVKLDYQASRDPLYDHIDQSGISDYQLLLREVEANGLLISEDKTAITIKERSQLTNSKLVLSRGSNLISYKITDKAMGNGDDEISKMLPQTAKTTIDPITGKAQAVARDVDPAAGSNTVTGKAKPKTVGVLKEGQVQQLQESVATKRIGGLPSVFVLPLVASNLSLEPLTTVNTKGFPGVLDRIWVVKRVIHKLAENTTTLDLVSPVEVMDTQPTPSIPGIKPEAKTSSKTPPKGEKGWIYPCSGVVTSPYGMRVHPVTRQYKMHSGIDIANPLGSPIYAVKSGVVSFVGDKGFGGGKEFHINHEGGFTSVYLHNSEILVKPGDSVTQGQKVSLMGNTGIGTGSHLHFTFRVNGSKVDPKIYFPKLVKGNRVTAKDPV